MSEPPPGAVTELLQAWSNGDKGALDELIPVVYGEIHKLAHNCLRREEPGKRLQTAELVNEAYLQLIRQTRVRWQSRAHFFGIAAQIMRRILAGQARRRKAAKRGSGIDPITIEINPNIPDVPATPGVDAAALDEALERLTLLDSRQGQLVELRFFGGLSIEETAEVMRLSPATVKREWSSARAWLRQALSQ